MWECTWAELDQNSIISFFFCFYILASITFSIFTYGSIALYFTVISIIVFHAKKYFFAARLSSTSKDIRSLVHPLSLMVYPLINWRLQSFLAFCRSAFRTCRRIPCTPGDFIPPANTVS